jgi:hypothetical protein
MEHFITLVPGLWPVSAMLASFITDSGEAVVPGLPAEFRHQHGVTDSCSDLQGHRPAFFTSDLWPICFLIPGGLASLAGGIVAGIFGSRVHDQGAL